MESKPKIVLIIPLMEFGGGQRKISLLANEWDSRGCDVTIVSLRKGEAFFPINDTISFKFLNYVQLNNSSKIKRLISRINTFFEMRKLIRHLKPDIVISILSSTNILTLSSTVGLRKKIFVWDVMSPYRHRTFLERISRKLIYPLAQSVFVNTNSARKIVSKEIMNKVKVFPPPIKLKDSRLGTEEREKIIISVGRLHPDKGHTYFLKACANLNLEDWKIVILGEGGERKRLQNLSKELGLSDKLLLPGAVENVDEWLRKSSIFCFTSQSESFGMALVEAMAAGLPVVSFDCDVGPREILQDGRNGFLVPLNDLNGLAERLNLLMNDSDLRYKMGKVARNHSEKYNVERLAEEIYNYCFSGITTTFKNGFDRQKVSRNF